MLIAAVLYVWAQAFVLFWAITIFGGSCLAGD
jgi:hypothetical protein